MNLRASGVIALAALALAVLAAGGTDQSPACDPDHGGITLPEGFCATVFADSVGVARHLVVTPEGDVYVALEDARRSSAGTTRMREALGEGGIVALRDTSGDGRADVRTKVRVAAGGSGIALRGRELFFSTPTTVYRYRLVPGRLEPAPDPEVVVQDIPDGGHSSRSLALDDQGGLWVNVGSAGNLCGARGASRGPDPCPELATRAGIWRYRADRTGQRHPRDGERYATGIRNAVALAWNRELGALFAASHGRDGLFQNWPRLFSAEDGAEKPSEEFIRVDRGQDYGWPYCYHDPVTGDKVLAPEYGGDGRVAGRCAQADLPLIGFPGHWGPDGLLFYTGAMFPARYRGGAFLAFHGSWNRSPQPQAGYKVVFVPFAVGQPAAPPETFADGFAGGRLDPGGARHRPVGLAQGPDGALFVSDDQQGRIWRVVYRGSGGPAR